MNQQQTEIQDEPMQYEHAMLHSLSNLAGLEGAIQRDDHPLRRSLFLADLLVSHVHPAAPKFIEQLEQKARHSDVRNLALQCRAAWTNLRKHFHFESLTTAEKERFYKRDGFMFFKREGTRKLLVVWTTIFNNFYLSNAAVAALFGKFDCSLLLLKDSSYFNYLKGVKGFASDLFGIGPTIEELARREGLEEIYMSGFSTSGYAALLTSLRIPCRGYLGFSQTVDLSPDSPRPPPYTFTPDVRARVDPATTFDLKPLLADADPAVPRTLFYGEMNRHDSVQAQHVEGMETVEVISIPKTKHNTVLPFAAGDRLLPLFAKLISG